MGSDFTFNVMVKKNILHFGGEVARLGIGCNL